MAKFARLGEPYAIGPDGLPLRRSDLPRAGVRWGARRKAEVLAALRDGLITLEDAVAAYQLSHDELESWRSAMARHGLAGLRATRLKAYRD